MLFKLAALGSAGYVAYKIYENAKQARERQPQTPVAGGPLSEHATLAHSPPSGA
jgi:uncharacterized membrane protein YebE (DUF533 family)